MGLGGEGVQATSGAAVDPWFFNAGVLGLYPTNNGSSWKVLGKKRITDLLKSLMSLEIFVIISSNRVMFL